MSLSYLRSALRQAASRPLNGFGIDTRALDQETGRLRRWLGERGTDKPSQDAIVLALQSFYRDMELSSLRHARLVCFGCLASALPAGHMLIEDGERFPVLLRCVDSYLPQPRAFRLCYRGLLYAYFGYDAEAARSDGARNWRELRSYLRDRIAHTVTDGTLPEWVEAIQANTALLNDNPGQTYGQMFLAGDSAGFEQARKALDIRDDSWLIWQLVVGQIDAAVNKDDRFFHSHLPHLLDLLGSHPLARNAGLKRILERYRACATQSAHPGLRDFAVANWGNPWLSLNDVKWSLVSDGARSMVAEWLKLILIQQFFGLLAADGNNDTRRLKFWERYHESIDDMYFALGNTALRHRGRDFQDIRKKMEGRLLALNSAGSPDNNAFIMCIGNHVVVEFGLKGNACYIFDRNRLPFELDGEVAGNSTALKHQSGERLLHHDGSWATWEQKFQNSLASRMRVRSGQRPTESPRPTSPDGNPSRNTSHLHVVANRSRAAAGRPSQPPSPGVERGQSVRGEPFTLNGLLRLCDIHKIRVQDLRDKNGNLWVLTEESNGFVSGQLRAWGFAYKADKGWWRK